MRYLISNKTVKVYVGAERKLWHLNEELLCDRVPFFRGAFKNGFKEGESKVLELPADDPDAFGLLVEWIYTQDLPHKICLSPYADDGGHHDPYQPGHEVQWLKLWVLADKLNLTELSSTVLKSHASCLDDAAHGVSAEGVTYVCENAAQGSALRKHMVAQVVETVFCWYDSFIAIRKVG